MNHPSLELASDNILKEIKETAQRLDRQFQTALEHYQLRESLVEKLSPEKQATEYTLIMKEMNAELSPILSKLNELYLELSKQNQNVALEHEVLDKINKKLDAV
jgi:hypothetical protein